jgi:hypothetical protein
MSQLLPWYQSTSLSEWVRQKEEVEREINNNENDLTCSMLSHNCVCMNESLPADWKKIHSISFSLNFSSHTLRTHSPAKPILLLASLSMAALVSHFITCFDWSISVVFLSPLVCLPLFYFSLFSRCGEKNYYDFNLLKIHCKCKGQVNMWAVM